MVQYFSEILKTFSIAQRIWALIILCISVFFITFGSKIIDVIKPDPTQQILVVERQKKEIISLNTQLDTLSFRVNELGQEVIDGQSECSHKRIQREKEIITQIDELQNMLKGGLRQKERMVRRDRGMGSSSSPKNDSIIVESMVRPINDDKTEIIISALHELKNKIKNKK